MIPRRPTPPPVPLNETITFPKKFVNTFYVDELQQRITILRAFRPVARCTAYDEVVVGPLTITIKAATAPPETESTTQNTPRRGATIPRRLEALPHNLAESDAKLILQQAVRILYSFYRRKYVCATLSTANFLIDRDTRVLYLSRHVLPPGFFVKGSKLQQSLLCQCAPEVLANQPYGYASDVWTLGVLLVALTGSANCDTEDLVDTNVTSPLINHLTPSAVSFACQCLKALPELRPSITDLLMHPFLRDAENDFDGESMTSSQWRTDEEEESSSAEEESDSDSER